MSRLNNNQRCSGFIWGFVLINSNAFPQSVCILSIVRSYMTRYTQNLSTTFQIRFCYTQILWMTGSSIFDVSIGTQSCLMSVYCPMQLVFDVCVLTGSSIFDVSIGTQSCLMSVYCPMQLVFDVCVLTNIVDVWYQYWPTYLMFDVCVLSRWADIWCLYRARELMFDVFVLTNRADICIGQQSWCLSIYWPTKLTVDVWVSLTNIADVWCLCSDQHSWCRFV